MLLFNELTYCVQWTEILSPKIPCFYFQISFRSRSLNFCNLTFLCVS